MKRFKIEITYPETFEVGNTVLFTLTKSKKDIQKYIGTITQSRKPYKYYINMRDVDDAQEDNNIIFYILGLNVEKFCYNTLKMENLHGIWPFTKTLDEQYRLLKALEHINEL